LILLTVFAPAIARQGNSDEKVHIDNDIRRNNYEQVDMQDDVYYG